MFSDVNATLVGRVNFRS